VNGLNIYCDESGHLEFDRVPVMVLGALWCPKDKARETAIRIREIKVQHGLSVRTEAKWNRVSTAKKDFYLALLDFFLDDDDLHFRGLVIPDKGKIDHARFNQDHDTWYYKMYFQLLEPLINPTQQHHIYLDIKDTRSAEKVRKLHDVLSNSKRDFDRRIIQTVQNIRSHEAEQMQIADLLIGALSYANRDLQTSEAKLAFVHRLQSRTKLSLKTSTLLGAKKLNVFVWGAA
jgi:Protein of unknown function (DUF3800)